MVRPEIEAVDIDLKTGTTLGFYHYGVERPNVFIISGFDGLSAGSVYTNRLLMRFLEDEQMHGSVTVLPVANPLAFRLGVPVSPLDSKPLDSAFPGNELGTVTERVAWEIWRRVSQADFIITLKTHHHSCISHVEALHREYIHVRNLATQIGLPYVVQSSGQRGVLSTEAALDGIPAVSVVQRGFRDQIDPQASVEVRESLINFLRIANVLPGEPIEPSTYLTGHALTITSTEEGFFIPQVGLGDNVNVDDIIGAVEETGQIHSQYEGIVLALSRMNYVFEGDPVAMIASRIQDRMSSKTENEEPRRKW